ncbi:MAG TPA: hypothetical protein VK934_06000 [Fimbriimonas sp.]|nr:hypothetical protein [Fimbriimonas sp.]
MPLLLLQNPQANVVEDMALQKKISVAIKAQPVDEAVKAIGKEAGVSCAAVQNLWDLKVTVLAKDEPAGPLMDRIADVLGAEWTKDGDVYRLGFGRVAQQQRLAYDQAEQRLLRAQLDTALLAYARLASVNPNAPAAKPNPGEQLKAEPSAVIFGQMLAQMAAASNSGFWRGETRSYAPPDIASSQQPAFQEDKRIYARFDPYLLSLERNPGSDPALRRRGLVEFWSPPEELAKMPFAADVIAWPSSDLPEDDKRFDKSVTPVAFKKSDFFVKAPTLTEHLEAFHKSTGLPVVADAFSTPQHGRPGSADARGWLRALSGMHADYKFKHAIVGVRHRAFWRLRQFEPSEAMVGSYQQLAQIEPLTLDQYAAVVQRLKPAVASALMLADALSLELDAGLYPKMMPALQFYAMLSPAQRRQARSGLEAITLNPQQKSAFVNAVLWGALKGYGKPGYLAPMLAGDFRELGVVVAEESFESGVKNKQGKAVTGSRKFLMNLGSLADPVRFVAEIKGPEPKASD